MPVLTLSTVKPVVFVGSFTSTVSFEAMSASGDETDMKSNVVVGEIADVAVVS